MAEKRPKMKQLLPLADLLEAVFAGKPAEKRMRESKVWRVWGETVGAQIAAKAAPAAFRDGVLTVRVASSPWMQQLSLMKPDLIDHLNKALGETLVKELFFKIGTPSPSGDKAVVKKKKSRPITAAEQQWVCSQTEEIADPELRQALDSLLIRHLGASDLPAVSMPIVGMR